MIEFVEDSGTLVVINPDHIVYIKNDDGTAIIKVVNNETFIMDSYDDTIKRFTESNQLIHLDQEAREEIEEAKVSTEASE